MDKRVEQGCLCTGDSNLLSTNMKVILPDQAPKDIIFGPGTVGLFLNELGVNPLEVIVSRNGTLVPEQAVIGGEDEIRVIRIAHGG
ncbi:MAG: thiamine biosynthesis protein ThiS [Methanoregula sp.]|uniref:thiamine biosynthesis protein ThiS n=1 Tax=Methanoregula sp. TaxID=2052170 RepID=UPI003C64EF67